LLMGNYTPGMLAIDRSAGYHKYMFKEFSEERFMRKAPEAQADVMPEAPEETRTYQRYQALGGKINEIDYKRVLTDATAPSAASMGQASRCRR